MLSRAVVLLIGHGSPVASAVAECQAFADALAQRLERPVRLCFLERSEPGMAEGLAFAAREAGAGGLVTVLPLFLAAGRHQKADVPAAVVAARQQHPQVTFRYGTPLGPDYRLLKLVDLRIQEALAATSVALPANQTTVLLVGRGSADAGANSEIARYAYLLSSSRRYADVEYAFQAAAQPDVAGGMRRCHRLGAEQVVVAPFILFTGHVYSQIQRLSQQMADLFGLRLVQASYLGIHPLLLDTAVQRLHEAEDGRAAMTCDLCPHRLPPGEQSGDEGIGWRQ